MVWEGVGFIAATLVAIFALVRSRAAGGFYDADVYGMTPRTHRNVAIASAAFALVFLLSALARSGTITFWTLAAFTLFSIFYLTSFLRGAYEQDE